MTITTSETYARATIRGVLDRYGFEYIKLYRSVSKRGVIRNKFYGLYGSRVDFRDMVTMLREIEGSWGSHPLTKGWRIVIDYGSSRGEGWARRLPSVTVYMD